MAVQQMLFFPIVCAWCEAAGVHRVLRYSDHEGSHGVCRDHLAELQRQVIILEEPVDRVMPQRARVSPQQAAMPFELALATG